MAWTCRVNAVRFTRSAEGSNMFQLVAIRGHSRMWIRASDEEMGRVYAPPLLVATARQNMRRQVLLDALLSFDSSRSALLPVRELSTSGALVDKKGAAFAIGAPVECVLRCGYDDRPVELRLPATVARADRDAVALQFGSYDNATYTRLVNVLYNA